MSKLLEFFLGSILIAVFTVCLMFFAMLQYLFRVNSATDCAWHGSARAWIDSNGNGLANPGEPPLGNVKIHVKEVENQFVAVGDAGWTALTDKDGDVQFNIPIPGCADTTFEVSVDVPEGYRLTTRPQIEAYLDRWESLAPERVYYFGFVVER